MTAHACIDPDCAHYWCATCNADICPDRHPSPSEHAFICAPCHDLGQSIAAELDNERRSA